MEAVARVICEGHADDVVYHDVSKVFDPQNHTFRLAKVKALGLDDVIVRCIESCLTGRALHIGGQLSGIIPMRSYVQQSSGTIPGNQRKVICINKVEACKQNI